MTDKKNTFVLSFFYFYSFKEVSINRIYGA